VTLAGAAPLLSPRMNASSRADYAAVNGGIHDVLSVLCGVCCLSSETGTVVALNTAIVLTEFH